MNIEKMVVATLALRALASRNNIYYPVHGFRLESSRTLTVCSTHQAPVRISPCVTLPLSDSVQGKQVLRNSWRMRLQKKKCGSKQKVITTLNH